MNEAIPVVIIVLLLMNLIGLVLIAALDRRLTRVEARVDNLPTHRDMTALSRSISDTAEAVASISGQTEAMTRMLRTIQEHLLEKEGHRR